jgi:hypothetical protein
VFVRGESAIARESAPLQADIQKQRESTMQPLGSRSCSSQQANKQQQQHKKGTHL